jgi:YD repeat-containing protein
MGGHRGSLRLTLAFLTLTSLAVAPDVAAAKPTSHATARARVAATTLRPATVPNGGTLTAQELPGNSNPSEPYAAASQGCPCYPANPITGAMSRQLSQTSDIGRLGTSDQSLTDREFLAPTPPSTGFGQFGLPLDFQATYNSVFATNKGALGYGWSCNQCISLAKDAKTKTVTITQENGGQIAFSAQGSTFTSPSRVIASLSRPTKTTYLLVRGDTTPKCQTYDPDCTRFTFDNTGHLLTQSYDGDTLTYAYDSSHELLEVTDAYTGRSLTFTYAKKRITAVTDPTGAQQKFAYDKNGDLLSYTDPDGNVTRYAYFNHELVQTVSPVGGVTSDAYDSTGRLIYETDPDGHTTTMQYDCGSGGCSSGSATLTTPDGDVSHFTYQDGQLVAIDEGTQPSRHFAASYDPQTLAPTAVTNPDGQSMTASYDALGNPVWITDPLGRTTTFHYDSVAHTARITDPMGEPTTMTYNANGDLVTESAPLQGTSLSQTVTFEHGDLHRPGLVTEVVDADGDGWPVNYDNAADVSSTSDPLGHTTQYGYDQLGRPTSVTDPLGNQTHYVYDADGNLTSMTQPSGGVTSWSYDGDGNLLSTTNPLGRRWLLTYSLAGRITAEVQPSGASTSFTYDGNSDLVKVTDPAGGVTRLTYDDLHVLRSVSDPIGNVASFTHDSAGQLTGITMPSGSTISQSFDPAGELLSRTFSDGTPAASYAYDKDGRHISTTDASGTTTTTYDSLGRVVATDGPNGSLGYTYDLNNATTALHELGHNLAMQHDSTGNVISISDGAGNTTTYTYDADGREITSQQPTIIENKDYDAEGRTTGIQWSSVADGTTVASLSYTRDLAGDISGETSIGLGQGSQSFTVNANGWVDSENGAPITYNLRGDVTLMPSGATLTYDADGQAVSLDSNGTQSTFTNDPDGRRVAVSIQGQTASSAYDAQGALTSFSAGSATYSSSVNGLLAASSSGGVSHTFAWESRSVPVPVITIPPADPTLDVAGSAFGDSSGANIAGQMTAKSPKSVSVPLIQLSGSDASSSAGSDWDTIDGSRAAPVPLSEDNTRFVYGPDGLPLEQIDGNGNALWYHSDTWGSTRFLTDDTGAVVGTSSFDVFGNPRSRTGVSPALGFDGLLTDPATGYIGDNMGSLWDPATASCITGCGPSSSDWPGAAVRRSYVAGRFALDVEGAASSSSRRSYTAGRFAIEIDGLAAQKTKSGTVQIQDPTGSPAQGHHLL